MSTSEKIDFLSFPFFKDRELLSKICEISDACEASKDLMVAVYLIDRSRFLYINKAVSKILGETYYILLEKGWMFWFSSVTRTESPRTKKLLYNFLQLPYSPKPLVLTYHMNNCSDERIFVKHELHLHRLKKYTLAINYFFDISDKEKIERCFEKETVNRSGSYLVRKISKREREVLQLISDGYSSKQIADMLCISNHTAISHRKNLIEKFKVRNTAQLVKRGLQFLD